MEFYQDYSDFLEKNNINNTSTTLKKNKYWDLSLLFLALIGTFISILSFANESQSIIESPSVIFKIKSFYFLIVILLTIYIVIVVERIKLFKNIRYNVGYFRQNMLDVILHGVDWNSIIIKTYWYHKLYDVYSIVNNEKIEFFKAEIDRELANRSEPKFPIDLSNFLSMGSVLVSCISFLLLTFGINGKEQQLIIVLLFLLMSPLFLMFAMNLRNNFNEKKNDYQKMKDYSSAMSYILDRRKLNDLSVQRLQEQENIS